MRLLALDPGERVGWAAGEIHPETPTSRARLEILGHGIAYLKDAALQTHKALVDERRYDGVVVEGFWLTAKGARVLVGSDLQPSQFLGMVRLCCWVAGVPVYVQQPKEQGVKARAAMRALKAEIPGLEDVRRIVAASEAVSHDDGHDGSATMQLWSYFFQRYV